MKRFLDKFNLGISETMCHRNFDVFNERERDFCYDHMALGRHAYQTNKQTNKQTN